MLLVRRLVPAVLALMCALAVPIGGQIRYLGSEPGRWRPWKFTAIPSARQERSVTAAELTAFDARLQALSEILRGTPVLAAPVGFAAESWGYLSNYAALAPGQVPGRTVPLAGGLGFGAFSLFEYDRDGKTVREEGAETQLLYFQVNQIRAGIYPAQPPAEWGSLDLEGFVEPEAGATAAGLPRFGNVFIFKANPKPLWIPLSIEDALVPVLEVRREALDTAQASYQERVNRFEATLTPEARASRRADIEQTARMMPDPAQYLRDTEESDRQVEAILREELATDGPSARRVDEVAQELRDAEAALSALPASERSRPACYDRDGQTVARRFRLVGASPDCRPLVKPNWDYFDRSLPRSAVQVLMLWAYDLCLTPDARASSRTDGCTINRRVVESLDWDAVRTWMDK